MSLPKFLTEPNPDAYLSNNYVVLDFETTNKDKGSALNPANRLVLATWVLGEGHPRSKSVLPRSTGMGRAHGVSYSWGEKQPELVEAVERADFIVAHNAKFELQWLRRLGADLGKLLVYDTMLGEYVRLGNRPGRKDLDTLLGRYGLGSKDRLVKLLIQGGVCPSEIPSNWLLEYGCLDTSSTEQAFLRQRLELKSLGLLPTLYTRCLATPVLADIELNGMRIDEQKTRQLYEVSRIELADLRATLSDLTGGINLDSPKQLGQFLYETLGFHELTTVRGDPDRTPSGGRRTDGDTIAELVAHTDAQRNFQRHFSLYGSLNNSVEILSKMVQCLDEAGGTLYANFNQAVTQTHRLSSSGRQYKIQFQNIPRGFKPLFRARNAKWYVGEVDGSQLEFRVGAHLGRDPQADSDIRNGVDIHRNTASALLRRPVESITPAERQDAKEETFGPLYGRVSGTPEQLAYYDYFRKRYSALYKTQKGWTYEVLKNKKLVTETGLIFYWPNTKLTSSGYVTNSTSIFNYPIQSLATADIIPIALVYMWHRARHSGLRFVFVNTVHDSVIAEVPGEEVDEFKELSKRCFLEDVYGYLDKVYGIKFTVPLGCEVKIGTHWAGKGKELIEEVKYG